MSRLDSFAFFLSSYCYRPQVKPDEVIAYGCAIQAAGLDGLVGDLRLVRAAPRRKPVKAATAAAYRSEIASRTGAE